MALILNLPFHGFLRPTKQRTPERPSQMASDKLGLATVFGFFFQSLLQINAIRWLCQPNHLGFFFRFGLASGIAISAIASGDTSMALCCRQWVVWSK
jgi:hypothetical protein